MASLSHSEFQGWMEFNFLLGHRQKNNRKAADKKTVVTWPWLLGQLNLRLAQLDSRALR
jgi:hypothetical protein